MSPSFNTASPIEDWLLERYASQSHDDPWSIGRYSACRLLKDSGIPCYLWAEDALAYYGVPTVVFDIHIVVDDVKKAADALMSKGWHPPPPDFKGRYIDIAESTYYLLEPHRKTVEMFDSIVALTAASDWDVKLPDIDVQSRAYSKGPARWPFIPPLHELLDSILRRWLVTPDAYCFFIRHIATFLGYLYGHVPILQLSEFANYLRPEHRQYHLDVVAGVSYTRTPFRNHSRKIRDSILKGEYKTCECSVSRDDERYFTAAAEARLLASLPPANHV